MSKDSIHESKLLPLVCGIDMSALIFIRFQRQTLSKEWGKGLAKTEVEKWAILFLNCSNQLELMSNTSFSTSTMQWDTTEHLIASYTQV